MANLNQNLKDYLSKSQAKEPLLGLEKDSSESFNLGRFNPFRKSPPENDNTNDVANSWFSQAQNDPICPGLVSVVFFAFEDIYRKKAYVVVTVYKNCFIYLLIQDSLKNLVYLEE